MSTFILELQLQTQSFQEDTLNKRFNIARTIYNALLNVSQKRYKEMVKTKEYRALMEQLKELSTEKKKKTPEYKAITKKLDEMRKRFGITEHAFQKDGVAMQHHFKKHIDADTCQKIATRLWKAYEDVLFSCAYGSPLSTQEPHSFRGGSVRINPEGVPYEYH